MSLDDQKVSWNITRVSHSQFILADSDKGSRKVLLKVFEIHDMQRAKVYVALYATKMVSPVNQVR